MKRHVAFALMGLLVAGIGSASAQDFPSRPVKLVLPQPPGGAVDLIARTLGERLSDQIKQPVIVENMQGGGGQIAAGAVARAAPDGYTLLMAVDNILVINPNLNQVTYDPFRDFVPVGVVAELHMVLVANPKLGPNTVRELIAYAKANPGKLNYASLGIGTQQHLGMELLSKMADIKMNNVAYRGTAPAMTDVVGGVVDMMLTGPPSAKAMSEGGKLKILAAAAPKRLALMPEVPTMIEAGVPGYEMGSWFGLLAPAATPKPVVERLSQELRKAVADPKFAERMATQGLQPVGSTPERMLSMMQADHKKWGDFIRSANIKVSQ
jgi:tripartite-type tricarboxylate transporter receptor subunit TctC